MRRAVIAMLAPSATGCGRGRLAPPDTVRPAELPRLDAYEPPRESARVDEQVFRPLVRSLRTDPPR